MQKRIDFSFLGLAFGTLLMLLPCGCTEDESTLGLDLQDPFTLYEGVRDTAQVSAWTMYDDSLSTAHYMAGAFGVYADESFGSVEAVVYSQISTPAEGVRISDEVVIDSVVMTLVIDTVFPALPDSTPQPLHIVINQLAEPLNADSAYLSSDRIAESSTCFFDDVVTFVADSVRLKMRESIYPVLRQTCLQADFVAMVKGFALRLAQGSQKIVSVDLSAINTRLTMYYHTETANGDTSAGLQFVFLIGAEVAHSMYFSHDYAGTPLATFATNHADSISGTNRLYLEPLGGTKLRLNLQPFLDRFRAEHPTAVIHYAELVLPVSDTANTQLPKQLWALKRNADGTSAYITDANVITNQSQNSVLGFDGKYHRDRHAYRMRVTRHLQELLRSGKDYGSEVIIDARRSSGFRAVLNGTTGQNPVMIDFVYSE